MCLISGSATFCRLVVIRRHGSTFRCKAGTVCLIAGSATTRRAGVNRLPGSAGRDQAGTATACLIAGRTTTRRAGGEPPAWICWARVARPGSHSVLDRWERGDSLAGGRPLHPAISVNGRRRAPACQRMGVPHSVLERCGSWAESVVRASRAGGAARACGPVCRPGPRRFRQTACLRVPANRLSARSSVLIARALWQQACPLASCKQLSRKLLRADCSCLALRRHLPLSQQRTVGLWLAAAAV